MFRLQLRIWSHQGLPFYKIIKKNLQILNEENGEISISMLASLQSNNQRAIFDVTNRLWHETLLRYRAGLQWEQMFEHCKTKYHRKLKPDNPEVTEIVNFFVTMLAELKTKSFEQYNVKNFSYGVRYKQCLKTVTKFVPYKVPKTPKTAKKNSLPMV